MSTKTPQIRKITISMPTSLVDFADREAACLYISRSRLIARALSEIRAAKQEPFAAEGYGFYAQEAAEFAEVSGLTEVEAW